MGYVAARRAALRVAVQQPGVHTRAHHRNVRTVLRHPLPGRGAADRAPAAPLARLSPAQGTRRGLWREGWMGAAKLVPVQQGRDAPWRVATTRTQRLGASRMVACRRR